MKRNQFFYIEKLKTKYSKINKLVDQSFKKEKKETYAASTGEAVSHSNKLNVKKKKKREKEKTWTKMITKVGVAKTRNIIGYP